MTFERLIAADVVAVLAALALLFAIGIDWYSTTAGEEARRIERIERPSGALGGEVARTVEDRAEAAAEAAEKNALQADGTVDRVILAALLATVLLVLSAGFMRAAAKGFEAPLTPSALAAVAALASAVLVAYRIVDQPGLDVVAVVKPGAPLALALLGVIALAECVALRAEETGTAWREPAPRHGEPRAATPPAEDASIESTR